MVLRVRKSTTTETHLGMDEALSRFLDRFSRLADEPPCEPDEDNRSTTAHRPSSRKREDAAARKLQDASLRKRFPALAKPKGR